LGGKAREGGKRKKKKEILGGSASQKSENRGRESSCESQGWGGRVSYGEEGPKGCTQGKN